MAAVLDRPQINLANVKTSITSIVEAQLDKINTMESSREIFLFIKNLFDKHNIDTKKSRDIIQNLATMRNVENARAYIYNFCLKGEGQGTLEIDKKPRYKSKMFKIDEKLKKIVSEDIEKIEVETEDQEITVETDGDAVKVEVEPKNSSCTDCEVPANEASTDAEDYAFFSDLDPEIDIDDIEINIEDGVDVDSNIEDNDKVEESKSIKESNDINPDIWRAIGRHFDYVIAEKAAEILENLADRALMQDNVEDTYEAVISAIDDGLFNNADIWEINALYDECELSDNAYSCLIDDLVAIVDAVRTGDLNEGIEKKYVKPLKDKINACDTKQDLDEIGACLDDFSDKDIDRILSGKVSNKDINKMFGGYNFVNDDFPGWDFTEGLGNTTDNLKGYKVIKKGKFFKIADDNGVELDIDFESDDAAKDYIATISDEDLKESKSIKEALSVAEFIDWHETTNYKDNENTFEAVYSILDKYPESEDDVKAQYTAASDEDKEAISRIIDKANETATEEPTVYLARAMHKMYIDGYNYQEIADTLGAPVSLVIKMIGSDSYEESLTESTEKQYVAIDTQDKDNKDNNRKYTEKQLIDFAKELIKIEEESSEPDQYKKRPELKDDLASAKKVLKYFMYDVKEAE